MDEAKAREILKAAICPDGALHGARWYLDWATDCAEAALDGGFTADELEAIAWWMRNKRAE